MALTNVWLAGYGGPAVGATAVWIAPNDGTVPSATQVTLVGWNGPVSGATPIWIAGYGGPPPAAIGAIPICIKGWSGSGGSGGGGGATSVWSAADAAAGSMTLSNGGLTFVPTGASVWRSIRGSVSKSLGKLYVEFVLGSTSASALNLWGFANAGFPPASQLGLANYSAAVYDAGIAFVSSGFTSNYLLNFTVAPNDVIALAIDFAGSIWIGKNGTWLGTGANPATGTAPVISFVSATVGALFPAMSVYDTTDGPWTLQSQPSQQKYLPPPGFQAWDGGPVTSTASVWSASDAAFNGLTLSNGGLTVALTQPTAYRSVRGTVSQTAGKYYIEFLANTTALAETGFGFASSSFIATNYLGASAYSLGAYNVADQNIGSPSGDFTSIYSVSNIKAVANDVWAIAVDFTAGKFWLAQNNVWFGSGNPGTATAPMVTFIAPAVGQIYFPGITGVGPGSGTWTLQSTAASQKYAPPSGFTPWDGAAAHSSQALAYLARTVGGNEGGNGTNIATLIDGLVADGVWAKLDALYVLAQQNQTDALLNLVGTSYSLTTSGAPTFTSYVGFNGGGSSYLITGFNPISAISPNYTRDSANFGMLVLC